MAGKTKVTTKIRKAPALETLMKRLAKVERELAKMKQPLKGKKVEAKEFIVCDEQGTMRARLGLRQVEGQSFPYPVLELRDEKGNMLAHVGASPSGALMLSDQTGRWRLVMAVLSESGPVIRVYDNEKIVLERNP